ncbi:MAG: esterase-like activity of phytase family protein [Bryobacteraceae bacterium]
MRLRNYTLLAGLAIASTLSATPVFVNGIAIPGGTGDAFGASVNDGRLGFFSDIYYDPIRGEWWGLSDRGPGGGTLNYDTRVQRFTVDVDPNSGQISNFQVVETIKFTRNGQAMDGIAPSPADLLGNSLDPEGIVINPANGHLYISDEYGPSVYEFDRTGALVREFTPPPNVIPRDGANVPNFASDATNVAGRRGNRGFEGLAISPDGQYVYAMLQSGMLDEGGGNGVFNRIVKFDASTGQAVAQYAYRMEGSSQGRGISALVAVNDREFLVLERNNRGIGIGADLTPQNKKVFEIDITGATDVTGIDLDDPGAVFTTVSKNPTPYLDLAANTLPELGHLSPEKWEGLAIGPMLNNGGYLLLAGTDNDYSVTQNGSNVQFDVYLRVTDADPYQTSIQCPLGQTTGCFLTSDGITPATLTSDFKLLPGVLHAYTIARGELNYVSPASVPEPSSWTMIVIGLGAAGWFRRRTR